MITSLGKRVNYIDNLRWITVFLLILYHTAMAYNTWGEANYIFLGSIRPIACIVTLISPWFMPLMFLLAGVSSYYSLDRRGYKTFIKERFTRLGIPLVFGLLFLSPALSFVADVTHNGFDGNYLEHYRIFFTRGYTIRYHNALRTLVMPVGWNSLLEMVSFQQWQTE